MVISISNHHPGEISMVTALKTQDFDIVVNVKVKTNELSEDEVTGVLSDAVRHETDLVRARRDEFLKDCQRFEEKYHFSSDEFLERFESGELGDDADFFEWFFVKEAHDKFERRYQILLGISL
jgi:hypothetical protein